MSADNTTALQPGEASVSSDVQTAIDAHVALYKANLEKTIKTQLGDFNSTVGGGFREVGSDFVAAIRGRPVQVQDATGAEHKIPKWLVWAGVVLATIGVVALVEVALHNFHIL
jgi:hypothetical protein